VPVVADGTPVAAIELAAGDGAPFGPADAHRLAALGVAAGIALKTVERAADIVTLKSYVDAVVQATSNGIIGIDAQGRIAGCNPAALRMLHRRAADVLGKPARRIFRGDNAWVVERARRVMATGLADVAMEAKLLLARSTLDVNASILPLADRRAAATSVVVVLDDVTAEKQARQVLSRYLDPRLAQRLLPGSERLGSRAVRATLLFCDLRNSTSLAERLGAQQTLTLLNEHFALMEECLRGERGMIDKFIGDALLATFGVPHPGGDDEDRAVRAAIAMTAALRRWNETRAACGLVPVEMGIGINTDVVVAGNVGAPTRMDYTVVGAGVNVAARLEKACKPSGAAILAAADTVRRLKGRYAMRPADPLAIPGRDTPVEVFEILDHLDTPAAPNLPRLLVIFRRAFACKRQGRFAEAAAGFSECLSLHPEDRGAMRQLDACRAEIERRRT
jgi:adenylate cyclase